ncbi:uncharacterized protein [Amphiura filiformis]|uniref:uncharacterized protein n=1 Tax=Amphiura filiformis TaxID=82378 RepID=UPI003B216097
MARIKLQNYFLAAGVVFLSVFTGILYNVIATEEETHDHDVISWLDVVRVILSITTLCLAVMCFHISYIRASKNHTLSSILLLYILSRMVKLFSILIWRQFDARAKDPRRAQEDCLKSLLKRNANTAYGKRNNFGNIKCLEDLRKLHPLTTYDHYEQYIERMVNGEKNVLLCEKVSRFGITSGTTGKGKLIPISRKRATSILTILIILQDAIGKKYGYQSPLQKGFALYVNPTITTTPGGQIIGPMHLYTDGTKRLANATGNVPWEAMRLSTEYEAYYLNLLFNRCDSNIGIWIGPFSSQIHKAMSRVELQWKQFVHDIKTGTIDEDCVFIGAPPKEPARYSLISLQRLPMICNPTITTTPGGQIIGPMHLYTDGTKRLANATGNVPWEAMRLSTEYEAYYLNLLFNLCDSNIGIWIGPFSSQIHKAMSRVELQWKQFVHDIKTGTIDEDLQIPVEVREACEKALSPDPERAEELRKEFEHGFDGIVRRIWPHMKCVFGIDTAQFNEKLNEKYAKGIAIVSGTYLSTEGDLGVNLWADEDKYALIPIATIYEFIPEENINEAEPKTLFLDEVKIGEAYEMVVTTKCGFYRYRFGDVIKVVDFYYNLPVIKFMYRSGQLLNLRAEKVTELTVDEAVHHMVNHMKGAKLASWTSAENTLLAGTKDVEYEEGSQFYLVFVELEEEENCNHQLNDEHRQKFDEALQERNNYYTDYRKAGTISLPHVYLVKSGTFKELQDYIIANSTASFNQFKLPRKLKTAGTLKLMLDSRVL